MTATVVSSFDTLARRNRVDDVAGVSGFVARKRSGSPA